MSKKCFKYQVEVEVVEALLAEEIDDQLVRDGRGREVDGQGQGKSEGKKEEENPFSRGLQIVRPETEFFTSTIIITLLT